MVGQPQKILVLVASWTWTSRPMTASYWPLDKPLLYSGVVRSNYSVGGEPLGGAGNGKTSGITLTPLVNLKGYLPGPSLP